MFIAEAKTKMFGLQVFEKTYNIQNGDFILCREGILYNQIKAEMIKIVCEIPENEEFFKKVLSKDYLKILSKKALDSKEYFVAMYGEGAYIEKITRVNVAAHQKKEEGKDDGDNK